MKPRDIRQRWQYFVHFCFEGGARAEGFFQVMPHGPASIGDIRVLDVGANCPKPSLRLLLFRRAMYPRCNFRKEMFAWEIN